MRAAMRAAAAFVASLLCACPAPSCPEGTRQDAARRDRLFELLATIERGRELRPHLPEAVCFREGRESVVTSDNVALLDASLPDNAAAARLGHLSEHIRADLESPRPGPDCLAAVAAILRSEERAWSIERELQLALGVVPALTQARIATQLARLEAEYRSSCR